MTITKLATDPPEWKLYDRDLTELGILKGLYPTIYLKKGDCGSGSIVVPIKTPLLTYIATPEAAAFRFIGLNYRGAFRGGFFVEQHDVVEVSTEEYAGWAITLEGRGPLSIIDDAIVPDWMTPGLEDIRHFGTQDITSGYGGAPIAKGMMLYHELVDNRDDVVNGIGQHLNAFIWHVGGLLANPVLLDWDFTDVLDSDGNAWTDACDMQFNVGTSVLEMVRQFAEQGYGFEIEFVPASKKFTLHAYKTPPGTDLSGSIIFWPGKNCMSVNKSAVLSDLRNSILVEFSDPAVPFTTVNDAVSQAAYRKRMSLMQSFGATEETTAIANGNAALNLRKVPNKDIALAVSDAVAPRVFIDYNLGDTVGYRGIPDSTLEKHVVSGLQLSWEGDNKFADVVIEVSSE